MSEHSPSHADIGRSVERLTPKVDHLAVAVARVSEQVMALTAAVEAENRRVSDRLDDLEAWNTWALRAIVGTILVALLGLVLVKGDAAAMAFM